ncbi:MAG: response regulator, partial [Oceanobacter sp.]
MKILIADDHAVVRQGYGALLKAMMPDVEVIEASNGTDAALLYIQDQPDVTVLDIKMPDLSGIEVCRRIRQRDPTAKILMFSMYEDASVIKEAMAAGALGYLSKSSPPDTMLAAVSSVSRSEHYLDERLE